MRLDYLTRVERDFLCRIHRDECTNRFNQIMVPSGESPVPEPRSWQEVRQLISGLGARNPATDPLFLPVLAAYKRVPDKTAHAITLYLFWPPLITIHSCLRRHDPDEDMRGSQVLWAFLRALDHLDLDRRSVAVGKKLLNDTQHEVLRSYAEERARRRLIQSIPEAADDDVEDIADRSGGDDLGIAMVESKLDRQWTRAHLRALVRSRDLSESDYLILLGCFLYGHSIHEMATRLGLTYSVARKRRQRALVRLERLAPHLSPTHPDSPLVWVGRSMERRKAHA